MCSARCQQLIDDHDSNLRLVSDEVLISGDLYSVKHTRPRRKSPMHILSQATTIRGQVSKPIKAVSLLTLIDLYLSYRRYRHAETDGHTGYRVAQW